MTKIQSVGSDGQWQKPPAPQKLPTASVAQSALRTDITRFIESSSPAAIALYSDATRQKQDNSLEAPTAHQDVVTNRSLAELPYLAHPELGSRKKSAQAVPSDGTAAQPVAKSPPKKAAQRERWRGVNSWWFMLIAALMIFLLTLVLV